MDVKLKSTKINYEINKSYKINHEKENYVWMYTN